MDPLDVPARHAVSPTPADSEAGLQLSAKTSGELLFLISDFLASVPGGEAASRQFIQSAHDAGALPLTRTYKGTLRRVTPTELSRAAGSVKASGLLTIVQEWIARHGMSTLISAPSLPQPRPPHSIVDTLRLRQTQPSTPHPLASTMRKFEQIGSLFGHTHETYCIMFDRTHSRLITGSNDWIIKIWCAQTGWLLHSLRGHLGPVDYLTINRENTMIASGCHDGAVRVWALASGKPVATLRTPQVARHPDYPNAAPDEPNARINRITAIVWSTTPFPENRVIVAATKDDGMLRVWRWVRGESAHEPARFLYPEQPLAISFKTRDADYPVCLSMDPSGLFLAAGGSDGVVRVYSTGPLVRHRFDDPPASVFGDGSSLAASTTAAAAAAGLPPLPVPPGGAHLPAVPAPVPASAAQDDDAMDVDPPANPTAPAPAAHAATAPAYPLLQPADMPCIAYLKHDGPMVDVQFSNKGDRLLAYAEDGQAHVWSLDAASGRWIRVPLSKDPIVPDPALAPTVAGQSQPTAGSSSQMLADSQVADGGGGQQQPKRKRRKKRSYDVVSSCWLEGDNYLVTTNLDGFIRVFESRSGQLVNAFRGDSLPDLSPDDPGVIDTLEPHPQMPDVFLTACSSSGYVALWHREASQPLWARKHPGVVSHCDISADGWTIAVSVFNDDLDPSGSQVTKLYAIARDPLVAPEEQFFASDRDLIDHTAAVPWLYDHAHPYFDENPQYVRPRGGDTYAGQPALGYRTSVPAGLPYNQLAQEDLTTADQARMLVGHVFAGYRVVEMSREEREAHAKAVGKRGRARRVAPPTPQFQLAVQEVEPMLPLPILDVDDPDDEDYHEGGSDGEAGGSAGADGDAAEHTSADGLEAAFHAGTDDEDARPSSSTSRRRTAAATPSPGRRSRRRATQSSQGAGAYDDDDPAYLATLRAIQDQDSGDDYEAPAHWAAAGSSSTASASASAGGGGGSRRLVRRASSTGSAAATTTPARSTRLRRSASNQSDTALDSPSRGTRANARRTRATNHMYGESLTRGLDMSGSDRDEAVGEGEDGADRRPLTRETRRMRRLRLHAVDESADENVPIPSSSPSSSASAVGAAAAGAAGLGTRRNKRPRVGSDEEEEEDGEGHMAAAASSSSGRPRRGAAAAAAPGRGSPARNRALKISDDDSEAGEEEEAVATHSESASEADGMQDDESSMESSSTRPRRRAAAAAAAASASIVAAAMDLAPIRSSQRARPSTRTAAASASASSSTSSLAPTPRLTRRSSSAQLDAALAAAAANEPQRFYPSWMYATTPDPYSYAPQLGDCVAFFPQGYATFLEAHGTQCTQAGVPNVYSKARALTVSSGSSLDHFFAIVQGIKVQPGSIQGAFQIELSLVRCDRGHKSVTVRYEGSGFPDFVLLRSQLKYALAATEHLGILDDVSIMGEDGAWDGSVLDVLPPPAVWGKFQVQWEEPGEGEAESDSISPWEIQSKTYVDSRDASERLPDAVVDKVRRLLRRIKHIATPAEISIVVPGRDRPISTMLISQRLDNDFYRHPRELAADLDRLRRSASSSGNRDSAVATDRERLAEVIGNLSKEYPLPDAASIVLDEEEVVHSGYDSDDQGFPYGADAGGDIVMGDAVSSSSSLPAPPIAGIASSSAASASAGNGRGDRSAKARAAVRISANSWHPASSPDLADLARSTRRPQARNASASSSRASSVSTVSTVNSLPAALPTGTSSRPRRGAAAAGSSSHFSIEVPALTRAQASLRPSASMSSISTLNSHPDFDDFMGDDSAWNAPPQSTRASRAAAAASTASHLSYAPQRSSDMEDEFLTQSQSVAAGASSASASATAARPSGRGPSTARRTSNGSAGSGKFPHRSSTSSARFADTLAAGASSDIVVEDELSAHQPRRAAVAALQGISHAARGIMSPTRGMPQSPPGPKRKSKRLSTSGASGAGANYAEWDSDGQEGQVVEASDEDQEEAVMQMSSEEEDEDDYGYASGRLPKRARYH